MKADMISMIPTVVVVSIFPSFSNSSYASEPTSGFAGRQTKRRSVL